LNFISASRAKPAATAASAQDEDDMAQLAAWAS